MRRTIAQELKEEGVAEGLKEGLTQGEVRALRQTLLRQLRRRFGIVPTEIVGTIEASKDIEQLDEWLDRFATASTLEEVGITKK